MPSGPVVLLGMYQNCYEIIVLTTASLSSHTSHTVVKQLHYSRGLTPPNEHTVLFLLVTRSTCYT